MPKRYSLAVRINSILGANKCILMQHHTLLACGKINRKLKDLDYE